MINSEYGGTMTTENLAGKISARIFVAYLKGKKDKGRVPDRLALSLDLYSGVVNLVEKRQINVKCADGSKLSDNELFGVEFIWDDSLADGEWELRWDD